MTETFELTYPEAPKSSNAGGGGSRRHWAIAHHEKQRWEGIYRGLLEEQRVPYGMVFCTVTGVVRWKHRNGAESHNYLASFIKPLADTLAPPAYLYHGKGTMRIAVLNPAPRWLPDDSDEYLHFAGLKFEYPERWDHPDPRVRAVLVVRLTAEYPTAAQTAAQGLLDAA